MYCPDSMTFRSYGPAGHLHSHEHVQIVLPLQGALELEIEGRGGRLDLQHGALVAPGAGHVQQGDGRNRFLILDCDVIRLPAMALEQRQARPFFGLSQAARHLLTYVEHRAAGQAPADALLEPGITDHVLPLLLDALFRPVLKDGDGRLQLLCERIRQVPGEGWSLERMAAEAGMGLTALNAAFRREFGASPARWLQQQRLQWAQQRLAEGLIPLARVAQQAGFSDQSALTRAMRRELGITPGRYRRQFDA